MATQQQINQMRDLIEHLSILNQIQVAGYRDPLKGIKIIPPFTAAEQTLINTAISTTKTDIINLAALL